MLNYCQQLLRIAKSDLSACRVLHANHLFAQAYFYFQQSVEKCNKALGLKLEVITVDDLSDFKHDQIKIYRELIKQSEEKINQHLKTIEPFNEAKNHLIHKELQMEKIPLDADKARRFFDSLRNSDLINLDTETVEYCIKEISDLGKLERAPDISPHEELLTSRMFQVADWIGTFGTEKAITGKAEMISFFSDKEKKGQYFKAVTEYITVVMDFTYIQVTLYYFALLTIQHSSQTRYISDEGIHPLDLYTDALPAISKLPEMITLLDEAIVRFENINNLKESDVNGD
jgi:hypothetical protein